MSPPRCRHTARHVGPLHGSLLGLSFAVALVLLLPGTTLASISTSEAGRLSQNPLPQANPLASATSPVATGAPAYEIGRPRPRLGGLQPGWTEYDDNWCGYDATGGGWTSVTATWVQPSVQTSYLTDYSWASFWVGLDGDGSNTVEQTGTDAYSGNGSVGYIAWYEMYPADPVVIPLTISPSDEITATVTTDGSGNYTLTLTDDTTGGSYTTTQPTGPTQPVSAEVIAEDPGPLGNPVPLADFGTVDFTRCAFNGQPISAFAWNQVDMESNSGVIEAIPSALGGDGASFSVTQAPTLTNFTPTSGPVGTSVTVTGTNFTGASTVSFDGSAATFTVNNNTQITTTVPAGASSGPITVTTPGGSATSDASFTVTGLSSDDTLSNLTVSAGALSPSFTAANLNYSDSVANSVTVITVTPTTNDSNASYVLELGGNPVTNPIALTVGSNVIDVVVTAQNLASQTYSITVTRAAALVPKLTLKLSGLTGGALKLGKRLTAKGTVTPTSLAGSKVRLTIQTKKGATWVTVTSRARTISVSGTYSWSYKPAKKGSYRMQATIAKTATNAAAATKWRTFKVK